MNALIYLLVLTLLFFASTDRSKAASGTPFAGIKSWGFQLQLPDPDTLADSRCDLLIVDYSRDGTAEGALSPQEVEKIRNSRHIVLSYLSIGEAEDYRYYWSETWEEEPPPWLGKENPDWPGNYPVRYWHQEWQRLIYGSSRSYLDRIMAAGFDGVYLDRVDAYYNWQSEHDGARDEMVQFVADLSAYARSRSPGFVIVAQNAEPLLREQLFLDSIDAYGKEDLFYGVSGDGQPNLESATRASLNEIRRALDASKPVFLVEYDLSQAETARVRQRALDLGMVPSFASRALADPPQCS
jgi:cysteinyl-tRNA synthetase